MSMEGNDAHAQHPSADIHQPDSSGVASSEIHFHLRAMRALGTMRSTTSRRLCRQGRPTRPRRTTHQTSRPACLLTIRDRKRTCMFQVRIHGRGGQGVVTAAELLSVAAFLEGKHAQAFPSFGSERTGAPVVSFCRIDDRPIRSREPIAEPDALIVQDPTLLHQVDLFEGLSPEGYVLINSKR